jgi:hypothetical protein
LKLPGFPGDLELDLFCTVSALMGEVEGGAGRDMDALTRDLYSNRSPFSMTSASRRSFSTNWASG